MLALVALWFLINIPLTLIGSYVGIRAGGFTHPVRVNQIPRQIPPTVWYLRPWPSALLAGIPPFGAGFLELFFLLNSLFGTKVYYAFGFLALTFVVTSLTTATVTILMCYFHLCAEEYRWHWRAFITGGGSAFWLFAYGVSCFAHHVWRALIFLRSPARPLTRYRSSSLPLTVSQLFYWATRLSLPGFANKALYLGYLVSSEICALLYADPLPHGPVAIRSHGLTDLPVELPPVALHSRSSPCWTLWSLVS